MRGIIVTRARRVITPDESDDVVDKILPEVEGCKISGGLETVTVRTENGETLGEVDAKFCVSNSQAPGVAVILPYMSGLPGMEKVSAPRGSHVLCDYKDYKH